MYQTSLFPLRTIVGDAVPMKDSAIQHTFESAASQELNIEYSFGVGSSIGDTAALNAIYYSFLPTYNIHGTVLTPGEGMDTLPRPPAWLPFRSVDPLISFFALARNEAAGDVSRKLSARFTIQLSEPHLVGGICFGGFPYLPSLREPIQDAGVNSSNFGLPREIRLTCTGATAGDESSGSVPLNYYLDAEMSATRQEIVSHAGFHFLCIDPTLTDAVTVHFSDYPTILKEIRIRRDTIGNLQLERELVTQRYGFAIPYFYVFKYQEKTRYRPIVRGGVLGATSTHLNESYTPAIPVRWHASTYLNEYRHVVSRGGRGNYYDFTAASVFGQQRRYVVREEFYEGKEQSDIKIKERLRECFISPEIPGRKNVVLYLAQAEDYERCVAGLRMLLPFVPEVSLAEDAARLIEALAEFDPGIRDLAPDVAALIANRSREELEKYLRDFLAIPRGINFCEKVGLRVFEIDPLDGVSPAHVPLDGKYATLLAEMEVDDLREIALELLYRGVRFVRPSNAKYFALELTNLDDKPGQFVVRGLSLAQSAHVSIHPRAAKTQQVKTLNFRIVGPSLAEDYAFLGTEGFNFSIERFVAGERKSVLFRANSLLDLLSTGAVKIFSNVRRRAVEFEKAEYNPQLKVLMNESGDDFERRYTEARFNGWRRSETGSGVEGDENWTGDKDPSNSFENYSSQELRTHTQSLFPDASLPEWQSAAIFANGMSVIHDGGNVLRALLTGDSSNLLLPTYEARLNGGVHQLVQGFSRYWKGIERGSLKVTGSLSVNQSPYGFTVASGRLLNDFVSLFDGISPNDPPRLMNLLLSLGTIASTLVPGSPTGLALLLPTLNGLNLGLSLTVAGAGLAANPAPGTFLPAVSQNAAIGSQGTITKQAVKTGYMESQFLNNSYDEGKGYTRFEEGEMKRIVTRREVPDTDRQRVKGAEVMWQGELVDIITGAIPLNFTLPATAGKMHFRTADDSLRVRFGSGVGKSTSVDFWFDINEETIRDDY